MRMRLQESVRMSKKMFCFDETEISMVDGRIKNSRNWFVENEEVGLSLFPKTESLVLRLGGACATYSTPSWN